MLRLRGTSLGPEKSLLILYSGFLTTGMVTTLLGPLLPWINSRFALTHQQLGLYFVAQFLSSTIATSLSSTATARFRSPTVIAFGYAFMASGILVLVFAAWPCSLAAPVLFGCGTGLVIPTSNLLAARISHEPTATISRLNACWTTGAIAWPFLAGFALNRGMMKTTLAVVVALSVLSAIFSRIICSEISASEDRGSVAPRTGPGAALLLAVWFFLYVGIENSISGWSAVTLKDLTGFRAWTFVPALFWICLLAGRLAAPQVVRRISAFSICAVGLLCALIGTLPLIYLTATWTMVLGIAICGIGLSAVFPVFIAVLSRLYPERTHRAAGLVFATAGLGGATLPWIVGALASRFNTIRAGLWVPALGSSVLLLLVVFGREFLHYKSQSVRSESRI